MNIHLTPSFRRPEYSFLYLCLLVLSVVVPASANKNDKAQIEADIRSAMVQGGYRQGSITVLAELNLNLGGTRIPGQYRLLWNSRENWLERIDVGTSTELLIAKDQQQFRQANEANPDIWISLARNAFDFHKSWRDGSEWKFDAIKVADINGLSAQCATFKQAQGNQIEICIDPAVEPSGSVSIQRVVQSATPVLDDAAKEAVTHWTYVPTMCHGTPVAQTFLITINFSLRNP